MTSEQLANAQLIVETGQQLGANAKQLLAALEAALVESNLRNLNYGDRDSQGLFQQRPSQGWGTVAQVTDPYYAAQAFFLGAGTNKGAFSVDQSGTAGQLAQRVQRSAFPGRYDEREAQATQLLGQWQVDTAQDVTAAATAWVPDDAGGDYFGLPDLTAYDFPAFNSSGEGPEAQSGLGPIAIGVVALIGLLVARKVGII